MRRDYKVGGACDVIRCHAWSGDDSVSAGLEDVRVNGGGDFAH